MQSKKLQELVFNAIDDAKGRNIQVLDVHKISDIADYMIIASGTSSKHVSSVADRVISDLQDHKCRPLGVEGKSTGDWVLLDFGDVVVHIMRPDIREFYNLEKLWGDFQEDDVVES